MNITITLYGQPITKKNSQQIIKARGHSMIIPSPQYRRYERECLNQIPEDMKLRIETAVNMQCKYYMPTRRRVDLCNLLGATCDVLVAAGVLADDNCRIVASHDGCGVYHDKLNPRVEITLTDYKGITL